MDTKAWYLSKTIWGVIISVIATLLQLTGIVSISEAEQSNLVDKVVGLLDLGAQFFGFLLTIYGRVKATGPIVWRRG